ncbi:labile enterotoxin outputA [Helicobacter pylori]|uniref:labile enterotoxin outputA n=1 Tax=Helicobacter pylori TaxID=210 RepID=UPI001FD13C2B|nr:labile enterotoxin outputA [Helicobacter pylori]UOS26369.1 labile enterotoxin outputA [Helicobacter pylori]
MLDFIHIGEKYGIKIEESFKAKINSTIQSATDQKLRVALVGGFSEGKTSIAATWIERLDKSMNIDHEIELVDTPGLFGFKEKEHDSDKIERYKDITKKYVSEAHYFIRAQPVKPHQRKP